MNTDVADQPENWHYLAKDFYDYAENIEAVLIHYAYSAYGAGPDWELTGQVQPMAPLFHSTMLDKKAQSRLYPLSAPEAASVRRRRVLLKLPTDIYDPTTQTHTNRYLLHYYFEIIQDGTQVKTMSYTEDVRASGPVSTDVPTRQAA